MSEETKRGLIVLVVICATLVLLCYITGSFWGGQA